MIVAGRLCCGSVYCSRAFRGTLWSADVLQAKKAKKASRYIQEKVVVRFEVPQPG